MQYLMGIVPPDDIANMIKNFQLHWKNNRIYDIIEPHITVKAQGGLTEDLLWLPKAKKVCEDFPKFNVELGKTEFFGKEVVYLSVHSAKIGELHRRLVEAVAPNFEAIKRYFELEKYTPHLSLGLAELGMFEKDLMKLKAEAEAYLTGLPPFEANFIRLYGDNSQGKYDRIEDISLK